MYINELIRAIADSKFQSFFYFLVGVIFLIAGFWLRPFSGSVPFSELIGVGGLLLFWGKGTSLVLYRFWNVPQHYLRQGLIQYYVIVGLNILSFWSLCGYFFIDGSLFHDNGMFYNFFHDNLQSLNYFGEPSWWFPHIQHGFPGYFFSILVNANCISPVFMTLATIFWFLGKAGIIITSILPLYIWYFGAIIPFLFSISVWLLARQILNSSTAIIFVCIVAAFSPGKILNFSDIGLLEISTYGFLFVAAYLNFIKNPVKRNFLLLVLSVAIICVTMGFAFLVWSFLFIISFFLLTLFPKSSCDRVRAAFRQVSMKSWLLALLLVGFCSLPPLLTMTQQGELERRTLVNKESPHSFMSREPGNPLLTLLSSTPGVGWQSQNAEQDFGITYPVVLGDGWQAYIYLGLLTLPLAIWGFIYSQSYWRIRIFILFVFYFSVIILQNYSPLFLPVLSLQTPLTAISHFNDYTYRCGGFVLLMLAAGLGLDVLQERRLPNCWLAIVFLLSVLFSGALLITLSPTNAIILGFIFGFTMLLGLAFFIVLFWL